MQNSAMCLGRGLDSCDSVSPCQYAVLLSGAHICFLCTTRSLDMTQVVCLRWRTKLEVFESESRRTSTANSGLSSGMVD